MSGRRISQALRQELFFAALMILAGLVGIYIPPLFPLVSLVLPLPLAVLVRLRDLKSGLFASAVFLIVFCLLPVPKAVVFLLAGQCIPPGLVLGLLFKNHAPAGIGIALSAVALAVFSLLGYAFLTAGTNGNLPFEEQEEVKRAMEIAADWYTRAGLSESLPREEWERAFIETARAVNELIPAQIVVWSIVSAFFAWLILRWIFLKLALSLPPFPPFSRWQFSWWLSWGVIGGLGLALAGDTLSLFRLSVAGKNILFVSGFLYFVAGLSVGSFFLGNWRIHPAVKWVVAGAAFFYLPATAVSLIVLGIADSFFNFRFRSPAK